MGRTCTLVFLALILDEAVAQTVAVDGSTGSDTCNLQQTTPCKTIRQGLHLAPPQGTVVVRPGTYSGPGNCNITITRPVTLVSSAGRDKTIIDCELQSRCLTIRANATISGLTFQRGSCGPFPHCGTDSVSLHSDLVGTSAVFPENLKKDELGPVPEGNPSTSSAPLNTHYQAEPSSARHSRLDLVLSTSVGQTNAILTLRDAGSELDEALLALSIEDFHALADAVARVAERPERETTDKGTVPNRTFQTRTTSPGMHGSPVLAARLPSKRRKGLHLNTKQQFAPSHEPWTSRTSVSPVNESEVFARSGGCLLAAGPDVVVEIRKTAIVSGIAAFGGGIALYEATASLSDVLIGNNLGRWGGGLISLGGRLRVSNSKFSNNAAEFKGSPQAFWPGNAATGGAIAVFGSDLVSLINCSLTGNTATVCSQCIRGACPQATGAAVSAGSSSLQMSTSHVASNALNGDFCAGGGIYVVDGSMVLKSSQIVSNSVNCLLVAVGGGLGGGEENVSMSVSSSRVSSNSVTGFSLCEGSGIHVPKGSLSVVSSHVTHNSQKCGYSTFGGGIWSGADVMVLDSQVSSNVLSGGFLCQGAGIKQFGGSLSVVSSSLTNNSGSATGICAGGAVFVQSANASISSSLLSSNSLAAQHKIVDKLRDGAFGGGFYGQLARLTLSEVVVSSNAVRSSSANAQGAALWTCCGSEVRVSHSPLHGNIAMGDTAQGGGVYVCNVDSSLRAMNMSVEANTVFGTSIAQGGGIYAVAVPGVTLESSQIVGNAAVSNKTDGAGGGGVCIVQAHADVITSEVSNNTAINGLGGGVLNLGSNSTVDISGGTISFNSAASGGGAYATSRLTVLNCVLNQNTGSALGGAFFLSTRATLKFEGVATNNDAALGGTLFSAQEQAVTSLLSVRGTVVANHGQAILIPVAISAALEVQDAALICAAGSVPLVVRGSFHRVEAEVRAIPTITKTSGLNVTQLRTNVTTLSLHCRACDPGTYQLRPLSLTNLSAGCHPCPFGGDCRFGENQLQADPGFWGFRAPDSLVHFTHCPHGYCCKHSCDSLTSCEGGRQGTLCGDCPSHSTNVFFSLRCVPNADCNDAPWAVPLLLVVIVLYTASLILAPSKRSTGLFSITLFFYQALPLVRNEADWDGAQSTAFGTLESALTARPASTGSSQPRGVCVLPGLDIVHILAANYALPGFFAACMGLWWIFLKLRPGNTASQEATDADDADGNTVHSETGSPSAWDQLVQNLSSRRFWQPGHLALIRLLQLSYSNLTTTSFNLLTCRRLLGSNRFVLFYQGTVECMQSWQVIPLVLLLVLTVVPWGLVRWTQRNKHQYRDVVDSLGWPFAPGSRHWLAVMLYQRWLLALLFAIVSSPLWRALLAAIACTGFLFLALWKQPLRYPAMQLFYVLTMLVLSILSVVALIADVKESLATSTAYDDDRVLDTASALSWIQFTLALMPGIWAFALTLATDVWPVVRDKWKGRSPKSRAVLSQCLDVELQQVPTPSLTRVTGGGSLCASCGGKFGDGEDGVYARGRGVMHTHCVE